MESSGVLAFFEWCEGTAIGAWVRQSIWAFPIIESVHLLGLCLLGGAVLIVDLRLLGGGLAGERVSRLTAAARPWLLAGIAVMVSTGLLLFLSEAVKCYYSRAFWVKISTLPVALSFTLVTRRRLETGEVSNHTGGTRLTGALSILLWFTVAAAGRWIGFSG